MSYCKVRIFCIGLVMQMSGWAVMRLPEKPLVIVTASYNNHDWCEKNLTSLFVQNYTNWRLIYINDCSDDDTGQLVEQLVDQYGQRHRVTIVHNSERRKHLPNQYDAIHSCRPEEIILIVDGDDWLAHDQVFARINESYSTEDVWLTYGQFWYWKKDRIGICKKLPAEVFEQGKIRDVRPWTTSHIRTYYAGLFQKIRYEDLLHEGVLYPMCADVATMMPMIDMAGTHVRFISEILYIYNDANNLCFYHDSAPKQRLIESEIRSKPRYQALENPPYL